jgi:hypothetical protein
MPNIPDVDAFVRRDFLKTVNGREESAPTHTIVCTTAQTLRRIGRDDANINALNHQSTKLSKERLAKKCSIINGHVERLPLRLFIQAKIQVTIDKLIERPFPG